MSLPDTIAQMVESMRGNDDKAPQDWSKDSWWDYQVKPKLQQAAATNNHENSNVGVDVHQRQQAPFDMGASNPETEPVDDSNSSNAMSMEMM